MAIKPISNLNGRLNRNMPTRGAPKASVSEAKTPEGSMPTGLPSTIQSGTTGASGQRGLGDPAPKTTNVSDIAAEVMDSNGMFMRQSEAQGLQMGNRRGLMNSSMSIGAAQTAALDKIVPMASQEATQRQELVMSDKQFGQALELQERDQTFISSEREATFANTMTQLGFEQAFTAAETAAERANASAMLTQELHADLDLANLDSQTRENLVRIEGDIQEMLTNLELDAQNREIASDLFVTVQGQYQQTLQTIINNPDMSAEDRNELINSQQGLLDAQVTAVEGLTGVDIDFETGAVSGGTSFDEGSDAGGETGGSAVNPGRQESATGIWQPNPNSLFATTF